MGTRGETLHRFSFLKKKPSSSWRAQLEHCAPRTQISPHSLEGGYHVTGDANPVASVNSQSPELSRCRLLRISRLYTGVGVIFSLREENELRANGTSVRTPQSERALRSARISRLWTKIRQRVTQPLSQWCYPRTTLLSLRDSSYLSLISFSHKTYCSQRVETKNRVGWSLQACYCTNVLG